MTRIVNACTDRPWGKFELLLRESDSWVKRVEVNPGSRLSLQRHGKRSEHWFIISGTGIVQKDDETISVERNSLIDIPVGTLHRIRNSGKIPLVFIEVAFGEYLGEDDIVRIEDDYARK